MQSDYGLWQCAKPCHQQTYDNEEPVRRMLAAQNTNAAYACVNPEEMMMPDEIANRSICIRADAGSVLRRL